MSGKIATNGFEKSCEHGQCGACTMLINGRRTNSSLTLAVVHEGDEITTIERVANRDELNLIQVPFMHESSTDTASVITDEHPGFDVGLGRSASRALLGCKPAAVAKEDQLSTIVGM